MPYIKGDGSYCDLCNDGCCNNSWIICNNCMENKLILQTVTINKIAELESIIKEQKNKIETLEKLVK